MCQVLFYFIFLVTVKKLSSDFNSLANHMLPTPKSHYALAFASNIGPDRIDGNILAGFQSLSKSSLGIKRDMEEIFLAELTRSIKAPRGEKL